MRPNRPRSFSETDASIPIFAGPTACCATATRGTVSVPTSPLHLPGLLRSRGDGREREAGNENDSEPDPPHGAPQLGRLAGV